MQPKISVIIPTYNLSKILTERSIPSVLNQTYKNLECLVVDDGSTDDTEARVKELTRKDNRLKYFKIANGGQSAAKNFGVKQATGEFIAFNDHDDEYLPNYLSVAIEQFKKLPEEVVYLSGGAINRDEWGGESYYLPKLEPFWKLAIGNGWVFRAKVFRENNIATDLNISNFEDLDLHIKLRDHGYKGYVINQPLRIYYVRIQPSSSVLSLQAHHRRYANSFNNFFYFYENDYKKFGREAISWLCFFGGLINMRVGNTREGKRLLRQSFFYRPTRLNALYWPISFCGSSVFNKFDNFKNKIMRFFRTKIS